jgi:hypothetical protein
MKKTISLFAIVLFSAIAVSAQTKAPDLHPNRESGQRVYAAKKSIRKNDPRILRVGPSMTYLKEGLSIEDVLRVLGEPLSVSAYQDADVRFATYTFERSEGRVLIVEFENESLVRSCTVTTDELAANQEKQN